MLLPIKDINPTVHFPAVTVSIIAVNIAVFLYELMLGPQLNQFIAAWGATPYEITHGVDLIGRYGSMPFVHAPGPRPIYLTLFSSMFMHGSFLHILGNMLYLWIFGNNIEDLLGPRKFLLFYLICGLAAAAAQIAIHPDSPIPTIGASGAVAGVLGAYFVMYPRARVLTVVFIFFFIRLIMLPASFVLIFWFVIQAFSGFTSLAAGLSGGGVAWFAHIGGFIAGFALIRIAAFRLPWRRLSGRW